MTSVSVTLSLHHCHNNDKPQIPLPSYCIEHWVSWQWQVPLVLLLNRSLQEDDIESMALIKDSARGRFKDQAIKGLHSHLPWIKILDGFSGLCTKLITVFWPFFVYGLETEQVFFKWRRLPKGQETCLVTFESTWKKMCDTKLRGLHLIEYVKAASLRHS